jgi:hypothetical protein
VFLIFSEWRGLDCITIIRRGDGPNSSRVAASMASREISVAPNDAERMVGHKDYIEGILFPLDRLKDILQFLRIDSSGALDHALNRLGPDT